MRRARLYVGDGVAHRRGSGEFDEESVGEGNVTYACVLPVRRVRARELDVPDEAHGGAGVRRRARVRVVRRRVTDPEDRWW